MGSSEPWNIRTGSVYVAAAWLVSMAPMRAAAVDSGGTRSANTSGSSEYRRPTSGSRLSALGGMPWESGSPIDSSRAWPASTEMLDRTSPDSPSPPARATYVAAMSAPREWPMRNSGREPASFRRPATCSYRPECSARPWIRATPAFGSAAGQSRKNRSSPMGARCWHAAEVSDNPVACVDGRYHAFSGECTVEGCALAEGEIEDGELVVCPDDGSAFDLETGEPVRGPAEDPVAVFRLRVDNGWLEVAVA